MHTLFYDLRYAVRALLRQPVFSLVALFTLALVIGANTAIFSLINSVLLHPLPYPHAERLVSVWSADPSRGKDWDNLPLSVPRYETIRDGQTVFEDLGVVALLANYVPARCVSIRSRPCGKIRDDGED